MFMTCEDNNEKLVESILFETNNEPSCFANLTIISPDECLYGTNYFVISWEDSCTATDMWYGYTNNVINHLEMEGYQFGFSFYGFGPNEQIFFQIGSNGILSNILSATTSTTDCEGGQVGGDCEDPNYCSDCDGCENNCCPNYCSGNYYYYNRSCSNGFCVGATSLYCPNGCDDDGCL